MKKITILAMWLAAAMTGCGGGSDVEEILLPDGIDGARTEAGNSGEIDCPGLASAYDQISKGMMPEKVKAIVGCEPYLQGELNGAIVSISFADSKLQNEVLAISFDAFSVNGKQGGAISKWYINSEAGLSKVYNFY